MNSNEIYKIRYPLKKLGLTFIKYIMHNKNQ